MRYDTYIWVVRRQKVNWPEDCRLQAKHVAKYNLIVITVSCLDVLCVLTVHNTLHVIYCRK